MSNVNIAGLDKAELLAEAFNASHVQGMGILDPRCHRTMTVDQAREELAGGTYFDYLWGRVLKINLSGDEVDPWGYDRDLGEGAFAAVVEKLRKS